MSLDSVGRLTFWHATEVVQQLVDAHLGQVLELRVPAHLLEHRIQLRGVRRMVPQVVHLPYSMNSAVLC